MNINETRKRRKKKPFNSISYTTGDIGLNIDRFNQAMGSLEGSEAGVGAEGALAEEAKLQEAKRYVRRYYVRPQNIFCSNKAEIIKTLIEIGDQNCTIYTLNNLGDTKDVSKLMNNDIIYYYDEGILYDKNHVRIFDYDLSIKKEEDRKKFAKVDDDSKEFKSEYEDRMTSATELEESFTDIFADSDYDVISADFNENGDKFVVSLNHNVENIEDVADDLLFYLMESDIYVSTWTTNGSNVIIYDVDTDIDVEDPFSLTYEDYNVYGEKLTEAKETYCSICGEPIEDSGHATDDGIVCDGCELHFAIGG